MIIKAERMRIEQDSDNNLWYIDFRDEEKGVRGRIEIPSNLVDMEDVKEFEVEIIPHDPSTGHLDYSDALIVFNAISFRTKTLGAEKIYSFSAGGLIFRLFSGTPLSEFKAGLKEYKIIVR